MNDASAQGLKGFGLSQLAEARLMNDTKFLDNLKTYDKDLIGVVPT